MTASRTLSSEGVSRGPTCARLVLPYGNDRLAKTEGGKEIPILSSHRLVVVVAGLCLQWPFPVIAETPREGRIAELILLQVFPKLNTVHDLGVHGKR